MKTFYCDSIIIQWLFMNLTENSKLGQSLNIIENCEIQAIKIDQIFKSGKI